MLRSDRSEDLFPAPGGRVVSVVRLVVCAVALGVGSLLPASPALAHTGFETSDPGDGSTVAADVSEVVLSFSGAAEPAGEGFVVLDPSGTLRTPDSVTADPEMKSWTLGFDPPLANGVIGVRWTVRAPDAHPINGSFSFTVDAPTPAEQERTDRVAGPRTTEQSAASEAQPAGTDTGEQVATQQPAQDEIAAQRAPSSQDLDDFLAQTEVAVPNAEGVGAFGRLLGFVGTMLSIGGLAFAAVVVRDHRRDMRSVLKAVRYAAMLVVAGTAIDLTAHLAVSNNGWRNVLALDGLESVAVSAFGLAVGLRAAAGILLFATARVAHRQASIADDVFTERELVDADASMTSTSAVGSVLDDPRLDEVGGLYGSAPVDEPRPPTFMPVSSGIVASVMVLLASFTFDGHTVTEGNRWITGAVDMVHVVAGSIWAGGVVAFSVVLWRRYRRRERLNGLEMALRFSVIAGVALAIAGLAGAILAAIILDAVSELWTTPWGQLLIAKTIAVAAAASLGTYNHFVVIPWMNAHPDDDDRSVKIRNTATGEALLLIAVIVVTAFLVGASSQT